MGFTKLALFQFLQLSVLPELADPRQGTATLELIRRVWHNFKERAINFKLSRYDNRPELQNRGQE